MYPSYNQPVMPMGYQSVTPQPSATAPLSIVHGKDIALSYPSQIGTSSYFLDDNEPFLYKKRLDNNGNVVEFRKFHLEEVIEEEQKPVDTGNFATKDDIAGIYAAIEALKDSITPKDAPKYNGKYKGGNNHESSPR